MRNTIILIMAAISTASLAAGWRADGSGSFPTAKAPTKWSAEENVIWKTKLPQWSNASPVIEGDRIFLCADPATILCLSKTDGSIIWQAEHSFASFLSKEDQANAAEAQTKIKALTDRVKALGKDLKPLAKIKDEAERKEKEAPIRKEMDAAKKELSELEKYAPPKTHAVTGYTSPTPVCDGKNVLVVFGSGVAACHSIDGKKKWARQVGRPTNGWGDSTSPAIAGNKAIIQMTDVLALDIDTGAEIWKVPSKQVFGSLVLAKVGGTDLIVTAEGKVISPEDGKVLADNLHKLAYSAPIVVDDVAYFIENGGQAFKLTVGEKFEAKELWKTEPKNDRYYASPVYHDGLLYAVTRNADFSVIDAKDGKVIHAEKLKLGGQCYPSVTFAGGKIFVGAEGGETLIFEPGRKPTEVARNSLEKYRSSPVFEGSRMYVRATDYLYCIGE